VNTCTWCANRLEFIWFNLGIEVYPTIGPIVSAYFVFHHATAGDASELHAKLFQRESHKFYEILKATATKISKSGFSLSWC